MKTLSPLQVIFILLAILCLSGCGAPAATSVLPSDTPVPPTSTTVPATATPAPPTATVTPAPATATSAKVPASPTLQPPAPAAIGQVVFIASHPGADPTRNELWLEFAFPQGDTLLGDPLSQSLESGTLDVVLPDGTHKTFPGMPPAPMDGAAAQDAVWLPEGVAINNLAGTPGAYFLSEYTFENYNDSPHGPQIRIPLETILQGLGAGKYQLSWSSPGSASESFDFEWDGNAVKTAASP